MKIKMYYFTLFVFLINSNNIISQNQSTGETITYINNLIRNNYTVSILGNELICEKTKGTIQTISINNNLQVYIYRHKENGLTIYDFLTDDPNLSVSYYYNPNFNNSLIISHKKDSNNGIKMIYTIAKKIAF
ncbi:MAG: hypothetical protein COB12_01600 [Flavobacterium sp.]|nr:MAG: hypothetical protein COB12_01600 [Flavobacterium sp.]